MALPLDTSYLINKFRSSYLSTIDDGISKRIIEPYHQETEYSRLINQQPQFPNYNPFSSNNQFESSRNQNYLNSYLQNQDFINNITDLSESPPIQFNLFEDTRAKLNKLRRQNQNELDSISSDGDDDAGYNHPSLAMKDNSSFKFNNHGSNESLSDNLHLHNDSSTDLNSLNKHTITPPNNDHNINTIASQNNNLIGISNPKHQNETNNTLTLKDSLYTIQQRNSNSDIEISSLVDNSNNTIIENNAPTASNATLNNTLNIFNLGNNNSNNNTNTNTNNDSKSSITSASVITNANNNQNQITNRSSLGNLLDSLTLPKVRNSISVSNNKQREQPIIVIGNTGGGGYRQSISKLFNRTSVTNNSKNSDEDSSDEEDEMNRINQQNDSTDQLTTEEQNYDDNSSISISSSKFDSSGNNSIFDSSDEDDLMADNGKRQMENKNQVKSTSELISVDISRIDYNNANTNITNDNIAKTNNLISNDEIVSFSDTDSLLLGSNSSFIGDSSSFNDDDDNLNSIGTNNFQLRPRSKSNISYKSGLQIKFPNLSRNRNNTIGVVNPRNNSKNSMKFKVNKSDANINEVHKSDSKLNQNHSNPPFLKFKQTTPTNFQPKVSLLTALLNDKKTNNDESPLDIFEKVSGEKIKNKRNVNKIEVYIKDSKKFCESPMKLVISKEAKVFDLIGFVLLNYTKEELKEKSNIDKKYINPNKWYLQIVDEGEPFDEDFGILDRNSTIAAYSTDEIGLFEYNDEKAKENENITPLPYSLDGEKEDKSESSDTSKIESVSNDAGDILRLSNLQRKRAESSGSMLFRQPSTSSILTRRQSTRTNESFESTSLISQSKQIKLKIYIYPSDEIFFPLWVSPNAKVKDVIIKACKYKKFKSDNYHLKIKEENQVLNSDDDIQSLNNQFDLFLMTKTMSKHLGLKKRKRKLSNQLPKKLTIAGLTNPTDSFNFFQPKTSINTPLTGKKSLFSNSFKSKSKNLINHYTNNSSGNNNSNNKNKNKRHSNVIGNESDFQLERYTVWRKQPMAFIYKHKRVLAIDGDYIYILPADDAFGYDSTMTKTSSFHIKQMKLVKQARRNPINFKIIIMKVNSNELKRYDFEALSINQSSKIVSRLNGAKEAYRMNSGV
ncbi:Avo1p ASCRUDRAFT_6440 [Ascoidea rubescens DSM 1968]|uniref:SIN1-domain-containing protein n=1 Tax=Ascoidea rubescens DSM 1968 TaxID=1344418 RepID=A0A1D2VMI2_9ASCO|nr:hypothetical protein ASCRUDRAFT_6440 [Ascoidea rubescens DSM 1968]ODV62784.1 hypothetical protein ASCRUDRAFT_6440 [Ascoidea rubescens DSM 1968]